MTLTWDDIEKIRDETFCRTPRRQVHSVEGALRFVNQVGFCFAFSGKDSHLPCLWHAACGERTPSYPLHTHSDPFIGLVWEAKDVLAYEKKIYYGKAIKKTPSMISLTYFPCFYRLARPQAGDEDYLRDFMRGELSSTARRIMDALVDQSPQITADLKLSSGLAHPDKRTDFDRAMAELQMKMYVVKIAEFYEPFTFLWELTDKRFAGEISGVKSMACTEARTRILAHYFTIAFAADIPSLHRLFGWPLNDVAQALDELVERGLIRDDIHIQGIKKPVWGLATL
jgi:hypothetical protein